MRNKKNYSDDYNYSAVFFFNSRLLHSWIQVKRFIFYIYFISLYGNQIIFTGSRKKYTKYSLNNIQ